MVILVCLRNGLAVQEVGRVSPFADRFHRCRGQPWISADQFQVVNLALFTFTTASITTLPFHMHAPRFRRVHRLHLVHQHASRYVPCETGTPVWAGRALPSKPVPDQPGSVPSRQSGESPRLAELSGLLYPSSRRHSILSWRASHPARCPRGFAGCARRTAIVE